MTELATAPAATKFRHPYEVFTWLNESWDIAKFWADHDSGRIRPETHVFDAEFIEAYATGVLKLDKTMPERKSFSILMFVNVKEALDLPPEALDEPLVIVRTRKGKGMLRMNDTPDVSHVLADGNHRIARAYFDGRTSLKYYALNAAQSRQYRQN